MRCAAVIDSTVCSERTLIDLERLSPALALELTGIVEVGTLDPASLENILSNQIERSIFVSEHVARGLVRLHRDAELLPATHGGATLGPEILDLWLLALMARSVGVVHAGDLRERTSAE